MPSAKIQLNKRRTNSDGTNTLILVVHIFNQKQSFGTGFHCLPANFSPTGGNNGISWVTAGGGRAFINAQLRDMLARVQDCILRLNVSKPPANLRAILTAAIKGESPTAPTLIATIENLADLKQGRTRELYLATAAKLRKFTKTDPSLDDVNKAWLER
ncbi:MAG: hypothetical protein LUD72_11635, partial [Bacteroidales bacterium]|nr:hypothetical protein [Bacteroidales bacterium]